MNIRRLQPGETELYKQVRLQALQEAPYAFPTTYAEAVQRRPETWQEQAETSAQGADRATFITFSEEVPIGMAALYRHEGSADVAELLQVWVAPAWRGSSLAWGLMEAVFAWGREQGFRRILAGVTAVNARARQFYLKYGFTVLEEHSEGILLVKDVGDDAPGL